jgi:hypothetical protein
MHKDRKQYDMPHKWQQGVPGHPTLFGPATTQNGDHKAKNAIKMYWSETKTKQAGNLQYWQYCIVANNQPGCQNHNWKRA